MLETKNKIKFPAPYSKELFPWFRAFLGNPKRLLDPMAGSGGVFKLQPYLPNTSIVGIEIEPEFAALHPYTEIGDALHTFYLPESFDAVLTSPPYGNRLADHHIAKDCSRRMTYTHAKGSPLHPGNAGLLQWGEAYRQFHIQAWQEVHRVLEPGGRFVLNIGNHIRRGVEVDVAGWHRTIIPSLGFDFLVDTPVKTRKLRYGANRQLRVDHEYVMLFIKQ